MVNNGSDRSHSKRAWVRPHDVPSTSAVGEQISLMNQFISSDINGATFARNWLSARRKALDTGERISAQFEFLMNRVFYALEDYAIDPADAEEGDLTDEQLRDRVSSAVANLKLL
ncbi:colicin immunity domain-containing protein [Nocardia higoensis]|uniref:colicin immunity domain-containing protein n=1 Tax=Nocardia higoensis TaxID=228599 RepID=UPI000A06AE69|nr:colicin immunity domain-containing protein [Nocardia higoensis]